MMALRQFQLCMVSKRRGERPACAENVAQNPELKSYLEILGVHAGGGIAQHLLQNGEVGSVTDGDGVGGSLGLEALDVSKNTLHALLPSGKSTLVFSFLQVHGLGRNFLCAICALKICQHAAIVLFLEKMQVIHAHTLTSGEMVLLLTSSALAGPGRLL